MNTVKPGRLPQLSTGWFQLALETLESLGYEEIKYQNKTVKERILDSIALSYWAAVKEAASRSGLLVDDIAKRLGLNRSTPHRWFHEETCPDANKVFGVTLIVLKKEIDELGFPRNQQVTWSAFQRTLRLIRQHECGGDHKQPTREEFVAVRVMTCHPQADVLIRAGRHSFDERRRVLEAALVESRQKLNHTQGIDTAFLSRVLNDWALPYALLKTGLPPAWSFLDGEVV